MAIEGTRMSKGTGSDNLILEPNKIHRNEELVSIIIPCYNSSLYISDTIDSVMAQTYKNWEMLIAYDNSIDNSIDIINKYLKKDKRIKLLDLKKKSGPAAARNKATEIAKGRYIAFLDSDDLWMPQKLEKQIKFMSENDIALSYSSYYLIDEYGNSKGIFITKDMATYSELLKTCFIGNLTAVYDTQKVGKCYAENVGHEDYTIWLKILKDIDAAKGIKEPLAKYRIHSKSVSANKIRAACWQWNIYRKIENLSLKKSIYYFLHYTLFGLIKYKTNK